jgi:uncharacterized protein DUF3237
MIAMVSATSVPVEGPTTSVNTEYLMTLYAPVDPPKAIDSGLVIYKVRAGGWVAGPKIIGKLISPTADWLTIMPSGVSRFDARGAIETDDGELIYLHFGGVVHFDERAGHRLSRGEILKAGDFYSITTPTFRTASEKYSWLNRIQGIGKLVEARGGEDSYVKYDIFIVT